MTSNSISKQKKTSSKAGIFDRMKPILTALCFFLLIPHADAEPFKIDSFDRATNRLGGKTGHYAKEPSRALALRTEGEFYGDSGKALLLKYDKKGEGGPYGNGGWCGYYNQVRKGQTFFDASAYQSITFYVKGAEGGENFKVGVADKEWYEIDDSVKSADIGNYLPEGKITTEWQKASIPLREFALRKSELATIVIAFETACFPKGAGRGTLYIDELAFE